MTKLSALDVSANDLSVEELEALLSAAGKQLRQASALARVTAVCDYGARGAYPSVGALRDAGALAAFGDALSEASLHAALKRPLLEAFAAALQLDLDDLLLPRTFTEAAHEWVRACNRLAKGEGTGADTNMRHQARVRRRVVVDRISEAKARGHCAYVLVGAARVRTNALELVEGHSAAWPVVGR